MKTIRIIAVAALMVTSGLALYAAQAQQSGIKRTDLQRHDLSIPGREAILCASSSRRECCSPSTRIRVKRSSHVLEGSLEYQVEGKTPMTLKAGDVLFIPAGTIHSAKNVGKGNGAELATYIVEKGKPLVVLEK
jgi:mannose-6-phosphate isomerase-like protein (cupin superfamily)